MAKWKNSIAKKSHWKESLVEKVPFGKKAVGNAITCSKQPT